MLAQHPWTQTTAPKLRSCSFQDDVSMGTRCSYRSGDVAGTAKKKKKKKMQIQTCLGGWARKIARAVRKRACVAAQVQQSRPSHLPRPTAGIYPL